jgi:hypothetical protein
MSMQMILLRQSFEAGSLAGPERRLMEARIVLYCIVY